MTGVMFRWLGVAGVELTVDNHVLVVDPYFTRFPLWRVYCGRVRPNQALIEEQIAQCDWVLVTHPHFDHLMDVPDVVHNTEAVAHGSSHTCQLLAACGVPAVRMREISVGGTLSLHSIQVEVLEVRHIWAPGYTYGPLPANLEPPLRARDYQMDLFFSFRIKVDGVRLLTDPGAHPEDAVAADLLLMLPSRDRSFVKTLLARVRPKVVIPYHWEDFLRSLSKPLRPFLSRASWSLPPIRRVNLSRFRRLIEELAPGTRVFEPEILHSYDLGNILGA